MSRSCYNCGQTAQFICSTCQEVHYCQKSCQRENWKQHSLICKQPPPQPSKKQTTIEYRLKEYAKKTEELTSQIGREKTFKKIEELAKQKMEPSTYMRIVTAMLTGMFEREVYITERINLDTMVILRDLLESKTKATQAQIAYIESELVLYGKAAFKLTGDLDAVDQGTFEEIIRHYQNAWVIVHGILGTDTVDEPMMQEEKMMGDFISRILVKTALLAVQAMDPPSQKETVEVESFIPEAWALLKHSTSNEIRKYANCIAGFAGIRQVGSVRERLTDRDARDAHEEAIEQIEEINLMSKTGPLAKLSGILHWIADGIEKNTESSNANERLVASQILIASVFCLVAGWRYTYGHTTKQEIYDETAKLVENTLGQSEAELKKSREELQQKIANNEKKHEDIERSYNSTVEDRTKFVTQLVTSREATKVFLQEKLIESGHPFPKSLSPDVKPAIAPPPGEFPKFDYESLNQITASATKSVAESMRKNGDVITTCQTSPQQILLETSPMNVIRSDFVPIVDKIMMIALWDLKTNPAYQEDYASVQELRLDRAKHIANIMNKYVNSNMIDRTSPTEYAAMVYALSHTYSREMELFTGQTQEKQVSVMKTHLEKQDVLVASMLGQMSSLKKEHATYATEFATVTERVKQAKDISMDGMNRAKAAPDHVVDVFFSDLKYLLGSIPAIGKACGVTVGLLQSLIKENLQSLFHTLNGAKKVLKTKADLVGLTQPTWLKWMESLGTFFTTTLKILLAINLVCYILKIVIPGILLLFSRLLGIIQQWMSPKLNPNDFNTWFFGDFHGGPRYVRWPAEGIYFAIGTVRVFLEGIATGASIVGGALTTVLPALLALLGTITNAITVIMALYSLLFGGGVVATVFSLTIAIVNLIFSSMSLLAYAKILPNGFSEAVNCMKIVSTLLGAGGLAAAAGKELNITAWIYETVATKFVSSGPSTSEFLRDPAVSLFAQ